LASHNRIEQSAEPLASQLFATGAITRTRLHGRVPQLPEMDLWRMSGFAKSFWQERGFMYL
jgi:hypothetical protein